MRFSNLACGCVFFCLPLTALGIPPRDLNRKTNEKPAPSSLQRPSSFSGTPSLSTSKYLSNQQKQPTSTGRTGLSANNTPVWKKQQKPSIVAHTPPYRPVTGGGPSQSGTGQSTSGTRPGQNASIYQRPGNRPVLNRPDVVVNRPDINIGGSTINRPTINRPLTNINNTVNRTAITNNNTVINQYNVDRSVNNYNSYSNDNYRNNNYGSSRSYYPQLHYHWQPSSWSGTYRPAYYNYGYSNVNSSWLSVGGANFAYVNPFYVRPTTTIAVRYDYSQPIQVPDSNYQETQDDLVRSERAIRRFDDAREVFRRGEYGRANELIDEAIELLPNDPTLHQFRALVLFARQRYQESAAALYSVLAVSPGWEAATVVKLYDGPQSYLAQVRDLEQFAIAHPEAIESRFLLAYHYILKGDLASAERMLKVVRVAQPNDRVVENLLAAINGATMR